MSDLHLLEDEATLYVLGRLTEAGRGEFEARLAQSAELRALVRELEEGAVAVAMASPQRRAPKQVWERIEKAVTEETKPRVMNASFWFGWLHNGWAAAAACLVGWLLYALWAGRAGSPDVAPVPLASEVNVQPGGMPTDSARTETGGVTPQPRNVTHTERRSPQANPLAVTREIGALRLQNAELEKQVTHLSQVLTQQQALLSESSRPKFFQLGPTSGGSAGATNAIPSPELQRALFLAMARELGWLQTPGSTQSGSTQANHGGVDFVDLHPGTNETTAPINLQSQIGTEPASTSEPPSLASVSSNAIPGFVSGTNMVLAFDSSVVATGSDLTFWTGNSSQGFHLLGSAVLGNNPLVVAIPFSNATLDARNFTVTAGTSSGSSNVIGQFPLPGLTPP